MKPKKKAALARLWKERIQSWQQSGLTQIEWSRQNNVNHHQLGYWKRKFIKVKTARKLIPLTVSEPTKPSSPSGKVLIHLAADMRVEAEQDGPEDEVEQDETTLIVPTHTRKKPGRKPLPDPHSQCGLKLPLTNFLSPPPCGRCPPGFPGWTEDFHPKLGNMLGTHNSYPPSRIGTRHNAIFG